VIKKDLKVMDMTAFTLCKENNLPIAVLSINSENSLIDFINNKKIGTIVS
jgi:uridylate kinase